jgi:hypothetical protein
MKRLGGVGVGGDVRQGSPVVMPVWTVRSMHIPIAANQQWNLLPKPNQTIQAGGWSCVTVSRRMGCK